MSWTFVNAGAAGNGNNAASLTPGMPTGAQEGDLLVLVSQNFGGSGSRRPTVPSGWSTVSSGTRGWWANSNTYHSVMYRVMTVGDTAPTISMSGTGVSQDTQVSRIYAFRPSDVATLCTLSVVGSNCTNVSANNIGPAATITPASGDLVLVVGGKSNDFNVIPSSLSGWNNAGDNESTTGSDAGATLYYKDASGATGAVTINDTGQPGIGLSLLFSFKHYTTPTVARSMTISENLGVTDTLWMSRGMGTVLSEALGVADAVAFVLTSTGAYVRILSEAMGLSDSPMQVRTCARAVPDSAGVTDSVYRVFAAARGAAEAVGLTDVANRAHGRVSVLVEPVGVADSVGRYLGKFAAITDAVGLSDSVARFLGKSLTLSEAVGLSDTVRRQMGYARAISEAVGLSDNPVLQRALVRVLNELVGVADDPERLAAYLRRGMDAVGISDATAWGRALARFLSEQVGVPDFLRAVSAAGTAHLRVLSEALAVGDWPRVYAEVIRFLPAALAIQRSRVTIDAMGGGDMREFSNGDTIRFLTTFRDNSQQLFDPTSTWGRVWDAGSTVCASLSALTRVSTGLYYADFQSDPASVAYGPGVFEGAGRSGAYIYLRREPLFRIV